MMGNIEVDISLIREFERRHRANVLDDLLDLLERDEEITLKKVDGIPVENDEGEVEHWPFKEIE